MYVFFCQWNWKEPALVKDFFKWYTRRKVSTFAADRYDPLPDLLLYAMIQKKFRRDLDYGKLERKTLSFF